MSRVKDRERAKVSVYRNGEKVLRAVWDNQQRAEMVSREIWEREQRALKDKQRLEAIGLVTEKPRLFVVTRRT